MLASLAQPIYFAVIHLLFASGVWLAAWTLTRSRRITAGTKYWFWVITSLYFVIPAGSVFDRLLAAHISWATPLATVGEVGLWLADRAVAIGAIWLGGVAVMSTRLAVRIWVLRHHRRRRAETARSIEGIPIQLGSPASAPLVEGIVRPRISLPEGLDDVLTDAELAAVLRHEVTHARRRDNLIWLVHELALCLLWFYPLVWIGGTQLALYRELSCDESVLREARGGDLIAALAKLAGRADASLLEASASSLLSHRLALLAEPARDRPRLANALASAAFAAVVVAGTVLTVGHTACCFRN